MKRSMRCKPSSCRTRTLIWVYQIFFSFTCITRLRGSAASTSCVSKLLNSAFFGLSLFPLYATARRFLSAKGAYLFGIATILSPVSSYSVYMMPEAMYFFVFWVVVYVTVIQVSNHIVYGAAFLGFALAALSTVKPHGLVIIGTVPFVLAGIYLQRGEEISLRRLAAAVVGCLLAFVTGRLVISYLAQGNFTISLVGKFYQGVLRPRQPTVSSRLLHVIRGHLAYLVVLFWPAIVLGVWPTEAAHSQTSARSSALVGLRIFCFAALGILISDGNEIHCRCDRPGSHPANLSIASGVTMTSLSRL